NFLSSRPEQPAFSCARLLSAGCAVEGPWLDCSLATSFDLELSCRTLVYRELQAVSQGRGLEPLTRQLPASVRRRCRCRRRLLHRSLHWHLHAFPGPRRRL